MAKSRVIRDWQARLDAATGPMPTGPSTWVELPDGRWEWRPAEPRTEATHLLPPYRRHELREDRMTQADDGLVSYDPDNPHDPALVSDGPGTWTGSDPADYGRGSLPDPVAPDIAVCPTCGTAVSRERLR